MARAWRDRSMAARASRNTVLQRHKQIPPGLRNTHAGAERVALIRTVLVVKAIESIGQADREAQVFRVQAGFKVENAVAGGDGFEKVAINPALGRYGRECSFQKCQTSTVPQCGVSTQRRDLGDVPIV